jgi:SAM-dependent methyltransferase
LAEIRRVLKPSGRLLVVDFTEPTSRLGRLQPVWLVHRRLPSDVRDLPELLESAGFAAVEAGPTGFGFLGYVQGRVG